MPVPKYVISHENFPIRVSTLHYAKYVKFTRLLSNFSRTPNEIQVIPSTGIPVLIRKNIFNEKLLLANFQQLLKELIQSYNQINVKVGKSVYIPQTKALLPIV